jgi:DNA-binding CsgD family transcriptional regulator
VSELTPRQVEVLWLLARGLHRKQIARLLGVSPFTVNAHCKAIYRRLEVQNVTSAVLVGQLRGYLRSERAA